jgi:hypothetical protein
VDVAINFARAAEDDRQLVIAAEFQDVKSHRDIGERSIRLLYQFVNFGMGGQVNHQIKVWRVLDVTDSAFKMLVRRAEVLEQRGDFVRPGIGPNINAEDEMAVIEQVQTQVGAYLPA